jgi:hypothetical protein
MMDAGNEKDWNGLNHGLKYYTLALLDVKIAEPPHSESS